MRWMLTAVCLAILTALISCGEPPSPDRDALVALYNATGGPNWSDNEGWLSDAPIREWNGVFTSGSGLVTSLYLGYEQLTGPIPPELGSLSNLRTLWLNDNQLTGPIPPELGNLSNLTELDLGDNQLTGPIPPELGNLSNLSELDLSSNQLTGPIPSELGNLSNLTELNLGSNQLTGPVPPELGNLSNLRAIYLLGNDLAGCVPEDLQHLAAADLHQLPPGQGLLPLPITADPGELTVVGRASGTAELSIGLGYPSGLTRYSYELHRSDNGESGTYHLVESNIAKGEYVDEGLDPDTTYYYRVKLCNTCGCSDLLDPAVGVITEVDGPADVPSTPGRIRGRKFVVGGASEDEAGVNWQQSPGATFYQVFQGSDLDAEVSAPATEYRDSSPNSFLFMFAPTSYKVRACNKAGCSEFTDSVTIR